MREMNRPLFHFSMDGGSSWIGIINTTTGYYKTRERRFNRRETLGMS